MGNTFSPCIRAAISLVIGQLAWLPGYGEDPTASINPMDVQVDGASQTASDPAELVGRYFAEDGQLSGTCFTVLVLADGLSLDIANEDHFTLMGPGEDGRWNLDEPPRLFNWGRRSVAFERGASGDVDTLWFHRGWSRDRLTREAPRPASTPTSEQLANIDTKPEQTSDGWTTSTLSREGLDPAPIHELVQAVEDEVFTGIDGVLIARNGQLVFERYFNGFDREELHDTRSSFKSINSLLVGIAADQGHIDSLDETMLSFFPDHEPATNRDAWRGAITVRDLLTMRSGMDCDEASGGPGGTSRETDMWRSSDWIQFVIDLPMTHEPGTTWSYCSSNSFMLGAIVANATGSPVPAFAKEQLFGPLQFGNYRWSLTPTGRAVTMGSFFILPRDFAKIGQLVLDHGHWQGQQVVPASWIDESCAGHVPMQWSLAFGEGDLTVVPEPTHYGYQWFRQRFPVGDTSVEGILTAGNGGQHAMAFPELQLVVVFTGSNYNDNDLMRQPFTLLCEYILRAATAP